jgi:hypothetical protein
MVFFPMDEKIQSCAAHGPERAEEAEEVIMIDSGY